jgi:uncharacterized protein YukE
MADDYVARYQGLSHQQLYDMLMAGRPQEVDTLAASWASVRDSVNGLAGALEADLTSLSHAWEGPAFDEFHRRVSSVSTFATTLGGEFDAVRSGLTLLSGPLREAQQQAESPAATDDHDGLVGGAAKGAAAGSLLGPVGTIGGGIVGGIFGHSQDEAEKERAHQRMISLVAGLAVNYDLTSVTEWTPPPPPPSGLPEGISSLGAAAGGAIGGITPHATSSAGVDTYQAGTPAGATTSPGQAPHSGDGSTSLLSGGDVVGADGFGAGGSGGSGLTGAGSGASSGSLIAGAAGLAGTGLAASLGGSGRAGAGIGSGGTGLASGGRAPGTVASDGVLGREGADRAATASTRSTTGRTSAAAAGSSGRGEDDEPDERTTWLTEDDMDWGGGDAAPPVFGHPADADDAAADSVEDRQVDRTPSSARKLRESQPRDDATNAAAHAVADGTIAAQ